jgi:hypothetical protein
MIDLEGEAARLEAIEAVQASDLECGDCCYRFQTTGRKVNLRAQLR